MGFLICHEFPRIRSRLQRLNISLFQHLCVLAILSLQNKPPWDILHQTRKLCWGHKSWLSVLGWGKMPSSPLVLGHNHRTPLGSGSVSLETLLWRVKMSICNGKIGTGKSGEKMGSKKECTKQEKGRAHADLFLTKHQPDGETGGDLDSWRISAKGTPKDAEQDPVLVLRTSYLGWGCSRGGSLG